MRRKGVPCGCTDNGGCCGLKEKLAVLWDRTIGSILRINGISPDGDGDFAIEAGSNIAISETGTGNGLRIDTTGGVSYYESGDAYVNVDNNNLEITVNAGVTGGLALQDDLDTVTGAVNSILDGTTVVPEATTATNATNATNATYLGSDTATVGSDTKPVKIVNGQAVEVTNSIHNKTYFSYAQVTIPNGTSDNATSVTITEAGKYLVIINTSWSSNSSGQRYIGLWTTFEEWLTSFNAEGLGACLMTASIVKDFNANDTVAVRGFQNSGSSLTFSGSVTAIKLINP